MKKLLIGFVALGSLSGFAFSPVKNLDSKCLLQILNGEDKTLYEEKIERSGKLNLYDAVVTRFKYSSGNYCDHATEFKRVEVSNKALQSFLNLKGFSQSTDQEGGPYLPSSFVKVIASPKKQEGKIKQFILDNTKMLVSQVNIEKEVDLGKSKRQILLSARTQDGLERVTVSLVCKSKLEGEKPLGRKYMGVGTFSLGIKGGLFMTDNREVCPGAFYLHRREEIEYNDGY
jgi:hypothetical protein